MRLLCSIAQADYPVGTVLDVIARLLEALLRDCRQLAVARGEKGLPQLALECAHQEIAKHGATEVAVGQFHQRYVAELMVGAQERELIFVAPCCLQPACMSQEQTRLTDQIE